MVNPINVNGRTFASEGEALIESTKESVKCSFQPSDKLYDLIFQGKIIKPQPDGTNDIFYLPGGPAKVEWITFIWGENGKPKAWGAQLTPDVIKFPWSA